MRVMHPQSHRIVGAGGAEKGSSSDVLGSNPDSSIKTCPYFWDAFGLPLGIRQTFDILDDSRLI